MKPPETGKEQYARKRKGRTPKTVWLTSSQLGVLESMARSRNVSQQQAATDAILDSWIGETFLFWRCLACGADNETGVTECLFCAKKGA